MNWFKQSQKEMSVWLDDERHMPADFDYHARYPQEVIDLLSQGVVKKLSLDHDLG